MTPVARIAPIARLHLLHVFMQPTGFDYKEVASSSVTCASVGLPADCKLYTNPATGVSYRYWYPNEDTTEYLYEKYYPLIDPTKGLQVST